MFRKSVSKVVPFSLLRLQRGFSASLPVKRIVATNPIKAEDVKVHPSAPISCPAS
jgi:succinate dehydrogenase (ubiquinone) flavoprotein subunit